MNTKDFNFFAVDRDKLLIVRKKDQNPVIAKPL